jgi:superfamily I DNA/RNA helicase
MPKVKLPRNYATIAKTAGVNHQWSDEQETVFDWFENGNGNLIVRARAGTGKTTTILEGTNRAPERRILLAAFNRSIADEMKARVLNGAVRVQTLHSLGRTFCQRFISNMQVDAHGERARELAKRACIAVLKSNGKPNGKADFDVIACVANLHTKIREILVDPVSDLARKQEVFETTEEKAAVHNEWWNRLKNFAIDFGAEEFNDFWDIEKILKAALEAVELAAEPTDTIDFADMIFLPLIHRWASPLCDLLVVDEAQDMSESQLKLALKATAPGARVCIVGDDRQAIYGFRGADSGCLDRLKVELNSHELGLKTTYRCASSIVNVARAFVPDFQSAVDAPAGEVIEVENLAAITRLAQPGDFILSRINAPLAGVCLELLHAGKHAYVKGSDIGRIIKRILDKATRDENAPELSVAALAKAVNKWFDVEKKKLKQDNDANKLKKAILDDQRETLIALIEASKTVREVRETIDRMYSDTPSSDLIMCSTVHRAKGLEADRVFLLGKTFARFSTEEDNLCYVGTTRARKTLFIVEKPIAKFTAAVSANVDEFGDVDFSEMDAIERDSITRR